MKRQSKLLVEAIMAVAVIYAFALMFKMFNEFFDRSSPRIEQTIVIQKLTRYNPIPISVLRVRNAKGSEYNVDVSDELASNLVPNAELSVVRKNGFLGKEWVEDRSFYESLNGTRTIQGFIYLAFASLIAVFWTFSAQRRFNSMMAATGSLFVAVALAFGLFWLLP